MNQIPLRARDGSIRAHALVDEEDFEAFGGLHWHLTSHGYVARAKRTIYLHRQILGLTRRDEIADHINGDRLDNRRSNLRVVTPGGNSQNVRKRASPVTSAFRGVSWSVHAKSWRATAFIDGKQRHLGYFKNEQEAALIASRYRDMHMAYAVEGVRRPA